VNPVYLDIGVQSRIQEQFEMDSQIKLPGFLLVCINYHSVLQFSMSLVKKSLRQ